MDYYVIPLTDLVGVFVKFTFTGMLMAGAIMLLAYLVYKMLSLFKKIT